MTDHHRYYYDRNYPPPQQNGISGQKSVPVNTVNTPKLLAAQNMALIRKIEEDYFSNIMYDLMFEVVIDLIWDFKIGNISLDELYRVRPLPVNPAAPSSSSSNLQRKPYENVARPPLPASSSSSSLKTKEEKPAASSSSSNNKDNNRTVLCPICKEFVSSARFAYHLEKCMNGGKRGSRRHYDSLQVEGLIRERPPKPKKEFIDPYPNSCIVKIKLRHGVPYGSRRCGATLEEFQECQSQPQQPALRQTSVLPPHMRRARGNSVVSEADSEYRSGLPSETGDSPMEDDDETTDTFL